jgi:hypothetical protein
MLTVIFDEGKLAVMSASTEKFSEWACDPRRTLEERYGAELLIESLAGAWKTKHGIKEDINYEADRLRRKDRQLNPAHKPDYSREDAKRTEEVLPEMKQFFVSFSDDRPLRDLNFLRFCPPLESIELRNTEIRDWSPLLFQTSITKLHVWTDKVVRDLRVLGGLANLQMLRLYLNEPWPDLRGLENLAGLRELHFYGNILTLRDIPRLPQMRHLEIHHWSGHNIPLRSAADLPEMPELRHLFLENTTELNGIGRFQKLRNLSVFGYFTDLTPLAELKELTHLFISGGDYGTIAPLATLPNLCKLTVRHELPPDLTPLADSPRLHEIAVELSPIVPPELGSLNATFNPWSEEFALPQPRPLAPVKLFERDKETMDENKSDATPRDWTDDAGMEKSEAAWGQREITRRLEQLLGKGWRRISGVGGGHCHVTISCGEDIDRLPEIIGCLRQFAAAARHSWSYLLIVDSLAQYERDMFEIYRDDGEEFNAEREREEWEDSRRRRLEHEELLKRIYKHRLQQELGTPPAPENLPTPENPGDETDVFETTAEDSAPEYDLGTRIHVYAELTEKAIFVHEDEIALAQMLFNLKAEL